MIGAAESIQSSGGDITGLGYRDIVTCNEKKLDEIYPILHNKYINGRKTSSENEKLDNVANDITVKTLPTYEIGTSTLHILDEKIEFKKGSLRHDLIMFLCKSKKNLETKWEFEDLLDKLKSSYLNPESKTQLYTACNGIQTNIAKNSSIKDFLIFDMSSVQVNAKYL